MSRLLAAQRALTVPGWVKDELWRRARATPSLDLRFAEGKSLVDATTGQNLVTFTRASEATFVNSQGQIQTAAINAPRFDHNPTTGESLGLLVEEARTNSIRNNTMVGAVAGTPGTLPTNWSQGAIASGLTREITGITTVNGISCVDVRISGTAASTNAWTIVFDGSTEIPATSGQAWTGSLYLAVVGGSTAGTTNRIFRVVERAAGGTFVAESTVDWGSATSSLQRYSVTRSPMGATTAFVQLGMYFTPVLDAAIDITLRIGLPQLEQGAFATSVIPTTGTAATRSADVASISGSNFSSWYRQDEGTSFIDANLTALPSVSNSRLYAYSDGTTNNRITTTVNAATIRLDVVNATVSQVTITSAAQSTLDPHRVATAVATDNCALCHNGGIIGTDLSASIPSGLNVLDLGKNPTATAFGNGTFRRMVFWPARLGNEVLQRITQ